MDELDELLSEGQRLPQGRDQVEVLGRAAALADSLGDLDRGFEARVALVYATYVTEQAVDALATFAWLVARADEDPERFESYRFDLGWFHKWMPGNASDHPQVPAERLVSLVDELERRHVGEGSERRQALAVRMRLLMWTGIAELAGAGDRSLEDLLVDWRASARTSLADCAMCEATLEAEVLATLGRRRDALATLEPILRGELQMCAGGPSSMFRLGVELLVEQGRVDEARDLFGVVHRAADTSGESRQLSDLTGCAELLARTGDHRGARRLALGVVPMLDRIGSPSDLMWRCAEIARALAPQPADESLGALVATGGLPGPPTGGWTIGTLRDALAGRARGLAAEFDRRNGTDVASSRIAESLDAPDLPAASLRGVDRAMSSTNLSAEAADAPGRTDPTASNAATTDGGDAVIEATRPAPPASEGTEALDAWVREQFDAWRTPATTAVLAERLAAAVEPEEEALCTSWLLGMEGAVDRARAEALVADERVSVQARARLGAVIARAAVDAGDLAAVPDLTIAPLAAVKAGEVPPVQAMRIVRNVVEASLSVGDDDTVDRALTIATDLDLSDPEAEFLLDCTRLIVAGVRRRGAPEPDPTAEERAVVAARDVLDSAGAMLGDGRAGPLVHVALLDATSTLMELADEAPPAGPLQRSVRGVPDQPDTGPLRARAEMVLADIHHRLDGPAAAMVHQRRAVDAVPAAEAPGLAGWTRRGLALQLQQLGRHDEALVQFAMAVELLRDGGDLVNAWNVEAARARCLLDAGDPNRAANVAGDLLAEIDEADGLPDELRTGLVEPALDIAIDAEVRAGADLRATRLLERFAELLEATGRPSVPAWSMGALCAGRAGDVERAERLRERGEQAVVAGPGPEHERDMAVLRARWAELLWHLQRNDEAAETAEEAEGHARRSGDVGLAAVVGSVGARAAHDEFIRLARDGDPLARAAGERAADALVRSIQDVQVAELDELANHLGERLAHLREDLDSLGS